MTVACLPLGCGPVDGATKAGSQAAREPVEQSVLTAGAVVTRYTESEPRRKVWSVRWKSADLTISEGGRFSGEMRGVEGNLYRGQALASRFRAELGLADRDSSVLKLSRGVIVETTMPKVRLTCDAMRWDPEREVIEATGNVRLETEDGVLGPFQKLWLSPELRVAGTPDLFEENHAH